MADRILFEANEQAAKTRQKAEGRAQKIAREAQQEAEDRKSRLVADGKKEIDRLREQQAVESRVQNRRRIYALQWRYVESLIQEALSEMEKIRDSDTEYRKYISGLISGAIGTLNEKQVVIHCDKRDSDLVNEIIKGIDMPDIAVVLLPDVTTSGGAIISSEGGGKEINGTIEAILSAEYEGLREKAFRHLFGDLEIAD
jgi:vacuolar-type H+-ATPase subunit E/Vma4